MRPEMAPVCKMDAPAPHKWNNILGIFYRIGFEIIVFIWCMISNSIFFLPRKCPIQYHEMAMYTKNVIFNCRSTGTQRHL